MRTVLIILAGFVLLATFVIGGRGLKGVSGMAQGSLFFIPVWFALAALNMAIGVLRAGYGVAEEAPILVAVFLPPAALALFLRKMWSR